MSRKRNATKGDEGRAEGDGQMRVDRIKKIDSLRIQHVTLIAWVD